MNKFKKPHLIGTQNQQKHVAEYQRRLQEASLRIQCYNVAANILKDKAPKTFKEYYEANEFNATLIALSDMIFKNAMYPPAMEQSSDSQDNKKV